MRQNPHVRICGGGGQGQQQPCSTRPPRGSSAAMNGRQSRRQVPSSFQRFSRRQHVDGLGYSAGRSHHHAPVLSTQRRPSLTARGSIQGRATAPGVRALRRVAQAARHVVRPHHCRQWFAHAGYANSSTLRD